jgi:hypothetical protein
VRRFDWAFLGGGAVRAKLALISGIVTGLVIATPTVAMTVDAWRASSQNPQMQMLAMAYVGGLQDAFLSANAELIANMNRRPIYCQPQNMALKINNVEDILNKYISNHNVPGNFQISEVLLSALEETFPCPLTQ